MMVCFFFKHKTAYEMRISDWSSDVCSSDLFLVRAGEGREQRNLRKIGMRLGGELDDMRQPALTHPLRPGALPPVVLSAQPVHLAALHGDADRTEERRVGNECVVSSRFLRLPCP